jgi:hypothetical protein
MGERRRKKKYSTMDGGPPSDDPIVLLVETFSPLAALASADDQVHLTAIRKAYERAHKTPTPVCAACDYEFAIGELPPLLYCTKPFIPKADSFMLLTGSICRRCAGLHPERLNGAVVAFLKVSFPDLNLQPTEGGNA